jgi:excinuclease UvrABC helicase subunit UvrB
VLASAMEWNLTARANPQTASPLRNFVTKQIVYVSATPVEFKIQTSIVRNKIISRTSDNELVNMSWCRLSWLVNLWHRLPACLLPHSQAGCLYHFHARTNRLTSSTFTPRVRRLSSNKPFVRPDCSIANRAEASQKSDRRYDRASPATRGKNERVLVTTLTKRTAEDLADYLI